MLVVSNRRQYYSDVYQSTSGKLTAGTRYRLSGKFGITGSSRASIQFALRVRGSSGSQYSYLNPLSVTSSELTSYGQEFTVNGNVEGVLIYGPPAGVDILIDSVALVASAASAPVTPAAPTAGAVLVNEQFERTANGWRVYSSGSLSYSTNAASGRYSLRASRRASRSSGPSLDLAGLLENGGSYRFRAAAYVPPRRWIRTATMIAPAVTIRSGSPPPSRSTRTRCWPAPAGSSTVAPLASDGGTNTRVSRMSRPRCRCAQYPPAGRSPRA